MLWYLHPPPCPTHPPTALAPPLNPHSHRCTLLLTPLACSDTAQSAMKHGCPLPVVLAPAHHPPCTPLPRLTWTSCSLSCTSVTSWPMSSPRASASERAAASCCCRAAATTWACGGQARMHARTYASMGRAVDMERVRCQPGLPLHHELPPMAVRHIRAGREPAAAPDAVNYSNGNDRSTIVV